MIESRRVDLGLPARSNRFTERLSWFMAITAALGGMYVILDPVITLNLGDTVIVKLGGDGFAEQLKGAVVALILIEGWKAVKEFWLGSSAAGQQQAESLTKIAVDAAPAQALAVAAARAPAATEAVVPVDVLPAESPVPVEVVTGDKPLEVTTKEKP